MYIFSHYVGEEQIPVPGYFIVFPLYTKNYYALPEEVQPSYGANHITKNINNKENR